MQPAQTIHGWLPLYKPEGMSSAAAVGKVKRLLKIKKIGHAGTLDPFACGMLPLAIGEATKTVRFMMAGQKRYRFTIKWGQSTDTLDREGEVTDSSETVPTRDAIEKVLCDFVGTISQLPPVYSAIKIKGKRACDRVRNGEEVTLEPRNITIHALTLCEHDTANAITTLDVSCGKGTYVRAIARDVALTLGACGHVIYLERMDVGCFCHKDAILLETLEETVYKDPALIGLKPVEHVLDDIPVHDLTNEQAIALRHGQRVAVDINLPAETELKVTENGRLTAIAKVEDGVIKPVRVFNLD